MRLGWASAGVGVAGGVAFGGALDQVAGEAEALEVGEAVVVAGLDVVGLGGRGLVAVTADGIACEDGGASLGPVGG